MRRQGSAVFLALVLAGAFACEKEKTDEVACDAPGGCGFVISTLGTGERNVTLIPDGEQGAYAAMLGSKLSPVCSQGVVCHGALWRIDPDGNVMWKADERVAIDAPFSWKRGVAYRTGDARLVVHDRDGRRLWEAVVGDPTFSYSVDTGLRSIFVMGGGQARRLDEATGEEIWAVPFDVDFPGAPVRLPTAHMLVSGYGGSDLILYRALDLATGTTEWEDTLPGGLSSPAALVGDPWGPILLVSDRLSLRDIDGEEIWGVDGVEGFRNVREAPNGDGYFVVGPLLDSATRLRDDGTVLWSGNASAALTWLSVTPDGHALVGQQDGIVRKLSRDAGLTLWQYGGVDEVRSLAPPHYTAGGNVVFYGANIGDDSDTHLSTVTIGGVNVERWDAGARITSIALSEGSALAPGERVFLSTADGKIYLRTGAQL